MLNLIILKVFFPKIQIRPIHCFWLIYFLGFLLNQCFSSFFLPNKILKKETRFSSIELSTFWGWLILSLWLHLMFLYPIFPITSWIFTDSIFSILRELETDFIRFKCNFAFILFRMTLYVFLCTIYLKTSEETLVNFCTVSF